MDLTTTYMGLKLKNPLIAAASPLSAKIDNYKRMEDAGISAVVNYSLFEEQVALESLESAYFGDQGTETFAEALTYFPQVSDFVLGPQQYLDHIALAKKAVQIPVIGSLNGCSVGGWIDYAKKIEEAGADALELNIYMVPTDVTVPSAKVDETYLSIVKAVKSQVRIPVAVKIGPYFSSTAYMAKALDDAGADALVLFNRFYQPDIDLDALEVTSNLVLSSSHEMRLPLRWVAILSGQIKASLAGSTGIHTARDVVKMLLAGADAAMVCSALLLKGIDHASIILSDLAKWMEENNYASIRQLQGSVNQASCAHPAAFERANYMKVLQSYRS